MIYFQPAFLGFFRLLNLNNTSDWFRANKATYEAEVKAPFERLVGDFIEAVSPEQPELANFQAKDFIYRIYRDVRFSSDKRPLKDHVCAWLTPAGKKSELPGFYFSLSDAECFVAGGCYMLSTENLRKIRQEIVYDPEAFAKLSASKSFVKTFGSIQGEALKKAPKDFTAEAEALPILKNKQFYFSAKFEPSLVLTDKLLPTLVDFWHQSQPMSGFLRRALEG
jgi:uncharacterized protein (TIGR02453 family)